MIISVSNLELTLSSKILIKEGNFVINKNDKVALIGRNGLGKSTLIDLIYRLYSGQEIMKDLEYKGKINFGPDIKISLLPQEVKFNFQGTVEEYLKVSSDEYGRIFEKYKKLSSKVEKESLSEQELEQYSEIIEKMNSFDLWDFEDRKKRILEKLGLNEEVLKRNIQTLSGGESTKVSLTGVLLSDANFWILDEPTNNLDEERINLLLEELRKFKGAVLIVTHDRRLLNVIGRILEIDEETKKIRVWGGNYEFYKTKKEEEFQARVRKYEAKKAKKIKLEKELLRLQQEGGELTKRVKALKTRISKEFAETTEPEPPERPSFPVIELEPKKGNLIKIKNLSYYFDKNFIFRNINLDIEAGDRIWFKGPIGSGKTTLLKCIMGKIEPKDGEVKIREGLKIGYLPQTPIIKDKKQKVKDYLQENFNLIEDDIKKILGKMKISEVLNLPIGELSIGEIRRLQIAAILFKGADLLILDEPTNHLDIYTVEELVEALKKYKGTIIFTSHDLSFVQDLSPNKQLILS